MLNNSTLRLDANKELPNYRTPWAIGGSTTSSATVTVVAYAGKMYLITNAHAVMDSTYLKIKLNRNSTEIPVEKCWVDPIMDLAIITTTTQEAEDLLIKEMQPLELVPHFQKQGTEVYAYGYPAGGKGLSFTKGNISRVELSSIALSKATAITVQTSAPINPGNSGGPITCMMDGSEKCIGIVAQGISSLQNTGYFIPACTVINTIERYIKFSPLQEKGFIDFVTAPTLSFSWQSLKNKPLRDALGLNETPLGEELTGIRVTAVSSDSCAYGLLQEGDIIQKIDDTPIQSNGHVQIDSLENPIGFDFIVLQKNYLDTLNIMIQRARADTTTLETCVVQARLNKQLEQSLLGPNYQEPLKYHIQPSGTKGAYVFIRLTSAYKSAFYQQSSATTPPNVPPFFTQLSHLHKKDASEIVILQNIIPSEETDGYESFPVIRGSACTSHRVTEANGLKINNLFDLVSALSDTSKTSKITFENGNILYIAPAAKVATQNLTTSHQITFFSSPKTAKIDPGPVIKSIASLGARDRNTYGFLKSVETMVSSECVVFDNEEKQTSTMSY